MTVAREPERSSKASSRASPALRPVIWKLLLKTPRIVASLMTCSSVTSRVTFLPSTSLVSRRFSMSTTAMRLLRLARDVTDEQVINDATIRGVFSNNFQITGLSAGEARELALLLRSGSLAIPLYPIEERAVGPSLCRDNIDKGVTALIVGMGGGLLVIAILC